MSRRVFLWGGGLALVALALAFTDWTLSLQPGVTEANVKRVRAGMSLHEVEAVLGAGTDWTEPAIKLWPIPGTDDGYVGIWFDAQRRVSQVLIIPEKRKTLLWRPSDYRFPSATLDPLARLRAWLGW
jgi:hypothetical protein